VGRACQHTRAPVAGALLVGGAAALAAVAAEVAAAAHPAAHWAAWRKTALAAIATTEAAPAVAAAVGTAVALKCGSVTAGRLRHADKRLG
jgi:hypothetical protein